MTFKVEIEREEDGRWIAEVVELPGGLAYGVTPGEATAKVQALALRVVADRLEHGEAAPSSSAFRSPPHDRLAQCPRGAGPGGTPAYRLDHSKRG
jgi:predicted RNase H-like HicB family nuclease